MPFGCTQLGIAGGLPPVLAKLGVGWVPEDLWKELRTTCHDYWMLGHDSWWWIRAVCCLYSLEMWPPSRTPACSCFKDGGSGERQANAIAYCLKRSREPLLPRFPCFQPRSLAEMSLEMSGVWFEFETHSRLYLVYIDKLHRHMDKHTHITHTHIIYIYICTPIYHLSICIVHIYIYVYMLPMKNPISQLSLIYCIFPSPRGHEILQKLRGETGGNVPPWGFDALSPLQGSKAPAWEISVHSRLTRDT